MAIAIVLKPKQANSGALRRYLPVWVFHVFTGTFADDF
jgi:hypothetical protein